MEPSSYTSNELFAPFAPAQASVPAKVQPAAQPMHIPTIVHADDLDLSMSSDSDKEETKKEPAKKEPANKPDNKLPTTEPAVQDGEEGDNEPGSYAKFKTTHEVEPESYYDENTVPKVPTLAPTDVLVNIGTVESVQEASKCLAKADTSIGTLDLDNVVYTEKRICMGFVEDVLGPITQPFYSILYYPRAEGEPEKLVRGDRLYCPLKALRLVMTSSLKEKKGCDASNLFDEEIAEKDMEFSDDEKESSAKKDKKKRRHPAAETEEAPASEAGKRKEKHKSKGQQQRYEANAMPGMEQHRPQYYAPPNVNAAPQYNQMPYSGRAFGGYSQPFPEYPPPPPQYLPYSAFPQFQPPPPPISNSIPMQMQMPIPPSHPKSTPMQPMSTMPAMPQYQQPPFNPYPTMQFQPPPPPPPQVPKSSAPPATYPPIQNVFQPPPSLR